MISLLAWFTNLFPVWVLLGGVLALLEPAWFTWFRGNAIVWGLAVIMLGMGITLSLEDFKRVLRIPRSILLGFGAHYLVMPFLGWSLAHALKLEPAFAVGLILVACCPSGTASNVVNYLAQSDVALSVLTTMCSTLGAVFMTPLLTKWLAGAYVPVDAWKLFLDTVQIVLLPVVLGLAVHHLFPRAVQAVLPVAPPVSVVAIVLICASIIGQHADDVKRSGGVLLLGVLGLHTGGFLLGYGISRVLGYNRTISRTVSIEVGMQNSGLGVALAQKNFSSLPTAPVPCAISSVFHSVIGSLLAGWWRLRPVRTGDPRSPGSGSR
ncbi:MAG: bile acid:sodium symporter family protein [Verrucomicrobia bacterium]|nr:bile acid:sodium symporter family protein [Verrucomicrobiota bacterium]